MLQVYFSEQRYIFLLVEVLFTGIWRALMVKVLLWLLGLLILHAPFMNPAKKLCSDYMAHLFFLKQEKLS